MVPGILTRTARAIPEDRLRRWATAEGLFGGDPRSFRYTLYADEKAATGVHEAGHTIAAWHLGAGVEYVQLLHHRRDGGLGVTRLTRRPLSTDEWWCAEDIVAYAGVAACAPAVDLAGVVEMYRIEGPPSEWHEEIRDEVLAELIESIVLHSAQDRRGLDIFDLDAFALAQRLLRAQWVHVEHLACELLKRVTVKRPALLEMLGDPS